jgi:hypothetical protein
MLLIKGLLQSVLASVITFVQLQGHFKYKWFDNNQWFTLGLGIPISALYLWSVKNLVPAFDGEMWPSRLLGFAVGAIVFALMTHLWFDEQFTLKTILCLSLATAIVVIQVCMK